MLWRVLCSIVKFLAFVLGLLEIVNEPEGELTSWVHSWYLSVENGVAGDVFTVELCVE